MVKFIDYLNKCLQNDEKGRVKSSFYFTKIL